MKELSVAICGLGGLGSHTATALVRAGVRKIHIIDFDTVDESNISRQQYFPEHIGKYKTVALHELLLKISPDCNIKSDCIRLTRENIPDILHDDDIICEAFDNAGSKAELVNCVLEKLPEKYIISGSGMAGTGSANAIKTRKVTDRFYICGDGESDIADGMKLVSSRVMICAGHQAHTVIRIINKEMQKND